MKLILEVRKHHDDEDAQHLVFTKFPVSIGRGFDNDVILNDAYVSPNHLQIEHEGDAFIVSDYSSHNGFTVNGAAIRGRRVPVESGDALGIGQMEVRLYKPDHPVPAAAPLIKDNPVFKWISRPINVWACFLLAVAMTVGWAWLEIWSTDEEGLTMAGAAAGSIGVIIVWAAIWAVGGRLTHHKANFKSHVSLICLYLIAGTISWYVEVYTDFLTNENWFAQSVTYSLNFILLGFLLYGSFALATKMARKRRVLSASFFSFAVMAGVFLFTIVSAKNFNQQPIYPDTLEPYLSQLAPTQTMEQFMAGNDKLFKSDEFAKPETARPATVKATEKRRLAKD